ncbi:Lactose regulatory protein LAC9 [Escovopsis weberi]|uniref:Lactose regulatory protein LAC9 n=1 Tax=Escovopsis weberi TaxID=150374 RepID=A0A0M8MTB4_ESCWE|nr:Lactose regulatory protein LAC9 [Escovopsis weberi]
MFYTFQGSIAADKCQDKAGDKAAERPPKGVHACTECKRRKIRCDASEKTPPESAQVAMPSPCPSAQDPQRHLEQMPTQDSEWDEERRERDPLPVEADDVNALSLTMDRQASYLGASSIKAALMVMLQIQPQLRAALTSPSKSRADRVGDVAVLRSCSRAQKSDSAPIPWTWKGQTYVDAYFKRVHVFTPMLDEVAFRADYLGGQRRDTPWLSLLNMVLAMGSIMATTSSDFSHIEFYNQAVSHLHISAFGSSHLETVQALILLGGFYLHYVNRPNMANAITGATLRMATALGLHREPMVQNGSDQVVAAAAAAAETRRRTWWSLFCVDAWAATTLGRPSFGRWCPAINLQPPKLNTSQEEEHDAAQHAGIMPLLENIKFCKIATQIQDKLATAYLLPPDDRKQLDGMLSEWYQQLPGLLVTTDPCAEPLNLSRCVIKWRYWNLRMLLHRPIFLTLASKGQGKLPVAEEDIAAVELCQELSKKTIESIANEWMRDQMSGWNAVWYLYQAAMVPLMSLMWQPGSPAVGIWKEQILSCLEVFQAMRDWSLTARRSQDVVRGIYEATCQKQGEGSGQIDGASTTLEDGQVSDFTASRGGEQSGHSSLNLGQGVSAEMLGPEWLWDPQVLYWDEQAQPMAEFDASGFNDGMTELGYL